MIDIVVTPTMAGTVTFTVYDILNNQAQGSVGVLPS